MLRPAPAAPPPPAVTHPDFTPTEDAARRLEQVLAASTADETEIVWLERRRGRAELDGEGALEPPRRSVLIRVVEGGRLGWYRTETGGANELESCVRQAVALSHGEPRVKQQPLFPSTAVPHAPGAPLHDPALSQLTPATAQRFLAEHGAPEEAARLTWSEARLVVRNSHGVELEVAATEATLEVTAGRRPGAGWAAGSARSLAGLDATATFERARRLRASGAAAEPPAGAPPALVAAEVTIELLDALNLFAFSGHAYLEGSSFLSRHRNVQVFDRAIHLLDDGSRAGGLPFPFDLEGSVKRPVELIVAGTPSTPALSHHQGTEAGLVPTAQAVGGEDSLFGNLFLLPGESDEAALATAADGGIRIGRIDPPCCFDPLQLRLRTVARCVRRVEGGRLGPPVADFPWEIHLLGAFARIRAVGRETVTLATRSTPLGGISAPALVLEDAGAGGAAAAASGEAGAEAAQPDERRSKTTV